MTNTMDPSIEKMLLDEITTELPIAILEKFSTLIRESGSKDEKKLQIS
ncbi:hypothetical protein [Planococcus koreensis]